MQAHLIYTGSMTLQANSNTSSKPDPELASYLARHKQLKPDKLVSTAAQIYSSRGLRAADPDNPQERALIEHCYRFCKEQGIRKLPDIFIADSKIVNAASLAGKYLIFTTTMMDKMPPENLQAVLGHELSHHRHALRDILITGGITFGAYEVLLRLSDKLLATLAQRSPPLLRRFINMRYLQHSVSFLGSSASLTPYRHFMEFEADRYAADLTSPEQMKNTLLALKENNQKSASKEDKPESNLVQQVYKLLTVVVSTHPKTEKRIARMDEMRESKNFAEQVQERNETQTAALER